MLTQIDIYVNHSLPRCMTCDPIFVALADPSRRALIETLRKGPASVGDLAKAMPVSRPAVSQHLKVLSDAGLLDVTPIGNRRIYSLSQTGAAELRAFANGLWDDALAALSKHTNQIAQESSMSTDPIVKTLLLEVTPKQAFDAFTKDLETWWPLESHSLSAADGKRPQKVEVTQDAIVETLHDGTTSPWGKVTAWQHGERFAMNWHVGRPESEATFLDVRFEARGDGTRITLIHDGWGSLGPSASEMRAGYLSGWDHVLGACFKAACSVVSQDVLIR